MLEPDFCEIDDADLLRQVRLETVDEGDDDDGFGVEDQERRGVEATVPGGTDRQDPDEKSPQQEHESDPAQVDDTPGLGIV